MVVVVVVVKIAIKTAKVDAFGLHAYGQNDRADGQTGILRERQLNKQTDGRGGALRDAARDDVSGVDRLKTHICSATATKLFDFNDISFPSHYLPPPQNSGPCNSFHCLGHSKKCR